MAAFPGIFLNPSTTLSTPSFNPTGSVSGDIFSVIDRFVNTTLPVLINRPPETSQLPAPPVHPQAPVSSFPFSMTEVLLFAAVAALVIGLVIMFAKR